MSLVILLIDNYDSFVHNLARYFRRLGQQTLLVRNDAITAEEAIELQPAAIVLSPGPCTPSEAGCSLEIVRQAKGRAPLLGVCLGHQVIGAAYGARVVRAVEPMHGRASVIRHNGDSLFQGLANPLTVGRYHSLVVEEESLPAELEVTARSADGAVMGLEHRQLPVFGVQFHPESVLTDGGFALLTNFLRLADIATVGYLPNVELERPEAVEMASLPHTPVTF